MCWSGTSDTLSSGDGSRTASSWPGTPISTNSQSADVPHRGHVSLRCIVAHLVEEVARHAGHADILRELTDGSTGR